MHCEGYLENPYLYGEAASDFKKYKCTKCGWKVNIDNSLGKKICPNCNNYIYSTKNEEFKDKFKRFLRKKREI